MSNYETLVSCEPVAYAHDLKAPENLRELGIPPFIVTDLVLRFVREHGTTSLTALRNSLKLSYSIVDSIFQQLRRQQFIEIKGTTGNDYIFSLTTAAKQIATERSEACRYAGPVPVPLEQYAAVVRAQRMLTLPTTEQLHKALADLVITDEVIDRLGVSLVSGRPMFIYGPTGNGKTSIIERLPRLAHDFILVPYAVEVDSHIISVFDPLVHSELANGSDETCDQRWVRCCRPCVTAGGELVLPMLNTRLDEHSGVYTAPLQMKAANGFLLIDDFGRQAVSPRELFNRWIIPLDRGVDYLSLQYGFTFQIPFEVTLAFATNLEPADLADEAFLRRVPNKIYVGSCRPEMFEDIFRRVVGEKGLPYEPTLAAHFRALCEYHNPAGLRACYPKDICEILIARAAFKRQAVELTPESLGMAADMYFARLARNAAFVPMSR
jgi:predicted ATPase with chaperone activity